jgi:uncharacterized lipoprotein YajG
MRRALVLAVLAMTACAPQTEFVRTNPPPRSLAARAVEAVTVFTTTAPERPYVEVGIVSARANTNPPQSKGTLIEAARAMAAEKGCEGLILAAGSAVLAEGTCIVFK